MYWGFNSPLIVQPNMKPFRPCRGVKCLKVCSIGLFQRKSWKESWFHINAEHSCSVSCSVLKGFSVTRGHSESSSADHELLLKPSHVCCCTGTCRVSLDSLCLPPWFKPSVWNVAPDGQIKQKPFSLGGWGVNMLHPRLLPSLKTLILFVFEMIVITIRGVIVLIEGVLLRGMTRWQIELVWLTPSSGHYGDLCEKCVLT